MTERTRDADEQGPSSNGPVGTVFGATLGPLAAAVGTAVDESRLALSVSVGAGTSSEAGDDDLEDAATIEIADVDSDGDDSDDSDAPDATSGAASSGDAGAGGETGTSGDASND